MWCGVPPRTDTNKTRVSKGLGFVIIRDITQLSGCVQLWDRVPQEHMMISYDYGIPCLQEALMSCIVNFFDM